MEGISIVNSVFKCCHSPVSTVKNELRHLSPQDSLKSISKLKRKPNYSKISLKEKSVRRFDKDLKDQGSKTNQLTSVGFCTTIPENENFDINAIPEVRSIKRVLSSPRTEIVFPRTSDTTKSTTENMNSPRSFQKKQFNCSLRMTPQSSSKSMKFKQQYENQNSQKVKIIFPQYEASSKKTTRKTDPHFFKDQKLVLFNEKGDDKGELGDSLHTLLSIESQPSESKVGIRMEESIIMVDYFHPTKSKIQQWGLTRKN